MQVKSHQLSKNKPLNSFRYDISNVFDMNFNEHTQVKTIKSLAEIDQIDKSELWQFIQKPEAFDEKSKEEAARMVDLWQQAEQEARQEELNAKRSFSFASFFPKFS